MTSSVRSSILSARGVTGDEETVEVRRRCSGEGLSERPLSAALRFAAGDASDEEIRKQKSCGQL